MRRLVILAVVSIGLLGGSRAALAQAQVEAPMAQRVPSDALVYVGWAGADSVRQTYAGSHAEALLNASNFQVLLERTFPALGQSLGSQNEKARPWVKFSSEILPILFRHPTAIAFGGVDWTNAEQPLPRILLVCDAGNEAPALRSKLAELFTMVKKIELVTLMDVQGSVVYLSLGWQKLDLAQTGDNDATSLLRDERFNSAMQGMVPKPATALFLDLPGLVRFAEEAARRDKGEQGVQDLHKFLDASGLRGLGTIALTTGFADKLYVTHAFVETRGARTGLLGLLDEEPIDEALLAAVPADAGFVAAGRFDASKLLEAARNAIMVAQPNQVGDFEQGLKFINMVMGADIENDLLGALGTSWAAYTSPQTTDTALGIVAINKPTEPQRVDSALKNLSMSLAMLINDNAQKKGQPYRLSSREISSPQGTLHYLDLPLIAPAWSTGEELVYFGFFPQTVASARVATIQESFAQSAAFESVKRLAAGKPIRGFTFVDLPRYSGRAYMQANMLLQLGSGVLSGYGEANNLAARFPPMVLPPYATFREHVTPAVGVSFVDQRGLHVRSTEPFPFSGLLGLGMQ